MSVKLIDQSPLHINFSKKLMTAYGGFSLLSRLLEKVNFLQEIDHMIPFTEVSPRSTGFGAKIIKLCLTTMAGGERFTHSVFLGDSLEIYEAMFGIKKIPKSITAVTRFFNRFSSWQGNEFLADKLWKYTFDKIVPWEKITEDFLTFDSTVLTRYGSQEGAKKGYNPKRKGRLSHHPILAFLSDSKYVVNLWNRSGDTSSGNAIVDFCTQTLDRLAGRVKIKGFLCDSGFYKIDFIKYSEKMSVEYVISAPIGAGVKNAVYSIEDWQMVGKPDDEICVSEFKFKHDDPKWEEERRYVVVRQKINSAGKIPPGKTLKGFEEYDKKIFGFRYGVFITSSNEKPEEVWRKYRLRARDENIIKEAKYDFGLEGFSMKKFYPTEAAMLFRILFYNIFNLFRSEILTGDESKQTLSTITRKYFIVPAVLGRDGKNPVLRLGIRKQNVRQKFLFILEKIDQYFSAKCIAFDLAQIKEGVDSPTLF